MIKLILAAITAVATAIVCIFRAQPTNQDKLREQIDELESKIENKRQAMSDALNAGFDDHFHALRREWLQLCGKRNRLRKRLS